MGQEDAAEQGEDAVPRAMYTIHKEVFQATIILLVSTTILLVSIAIL